MSHSKKRESPGFTPDLKRENSPKTPPAQTTLPAECRTAAQEFILEFIRSHGSTFEQIVKVYAVGLTDRENKVIETIQETYVTLWRKFIDQTVFDGPELLPFTLGIARKIILRHQYQCRRRKAGLPLSPDHDDPYTEDPDQMMLLHEIWSDIREGLDNIENPRDRGVMWQLLINRSQDDGPNYRQVAADEGIEVHTARNIYRKYNPLIRQLMVDKGWLPAHPEEGDRS